MRNNFRLIIALLVLIVFGCGKDDDSQPAPEPTNSAPIISDQSFNASEAISDSEVIGTVGADDVDGDNLTFSIQTNDNGLFEITNAGELSLAQGQALDYENDTDHTIIVNVSDGKLDTSADVTVTVIDVDENTAPTISDQTFSIDENSPIGTVIGTLTASDAEGDNITFSTGTNSTIFAISTQGEVTVAAELNFENLTQPFEILSINASDGSLQDQAALTININDINDAPAFDSNTVSFDVTEDISDMLNINGVTATGEDNDAVVYTITNDVDNLFELASNSGVTKSQNGTSALFKLQPGKSLDFETSTSHTFSVVATDTNGASAQIDITINVLDVAEIDPNAFVTVWQLTGANQGIEFYTSSLTNLSYNYTVDWGDGVVETGFTGNAFHQYADAGTYTVQITGAFPAIEFGNISSSQYRESIRSIEQWGNIEWETMRQAFFRCTNLEYNATDAPDLSRVTDMGEMFFGCTSFNATNLNNWDVSTIVEMDFALAQCTNFNGAIGDWDVSSVENMESLFEFSSSFNQPLNDWDVSAVTTMKQMFRLANAFNQPLNNWDVSSVENFDSTFSENIAFNQPLSVWNPISALTMQNMFFRATAFNQPLNSWDVTSVIDMRGMFQNASLFNQPLDGWDVTNAERMTNMFNGATAFSQDLSGWNTINVTDCFGFDTNSGLQQSQLPTAGGCLF